MPLTSWPCVPQPQMQFGMWQMTQVGWWKWQPNWTMPPSWGMPPLPTPLPIGGAQPSQHIPEWHVHPNAQQLPTRWFISPT